MFRGRPSRIKPALETSDTCTRITLLSRIIDLLRECRVAIGTASAALLLYVLMRFLCVISSWNHSFTRLFTLLRISQTTARKSASIQHPESHFASLWEDTDVDYIAKAYCKSLSKVQRVSVEASLSVVAHSYEGEDAANLLKGRSHIGGPSCRRQESERQFKKSAFLECSRSAIIPHWFLSVPATTGPSAILLHLLVVRGRDFDHFGLRKIPTDLLVRRKSYFDKCNASPRY
jgi:hypothetical protein